MISKYKTIHILLTNVHLDSWGGGGGGYSNRNASRDESVETGDESVEAGDESIEAREKHNNHVIMRSDTSTLFLSRLKIYQTITYMSFYVNFMGG